MADNFCCKSGSLVRHRRKGILAQLSCISFRFFLALSAGDEVVDKHVGFHQLSCLLVCFFVVLEVESEGGCEVERAGSEPEYHSLPPQMDFQIFRSGILRP